MKIKNTSSISFLLPLFCVGFMLRAEESEKGFIKKFKSGTMFTQENTTEKENGDIFRISTGKSTISFVSSVNNFDEITIMRRNLKSVTFITDLNFDTEWDLRETVQLKGVEIDASSKKSEIFLSGSWIDVKIRNAGGYSDLEGKEYVFSSADGKWVPIQHSPP